ncbi:hypothetical protein ACGGZK_07840 [Agromyces sp. MMS24-K17]|uniref:hypothetical protein n=1 Tax=Agromyces sp. MMS24-K17 TaxID=3372850 RepID=UPI0037550251
MNPTPDTAPLGTVLGWLELFGLAVALVLVVNWVVDFDEPSEWVPLASAAIVVSVVALADVIRRRIRPRPGLSAAL